MVIIDPKITILLLLPKAWLFENYRRHCLFNIKYRMALQCNKTLLKRNIKAHLHIHLHFIEFLKELSWFGHPK